MRGEIRAGGEAVVNASLRRQGILITKVKKRRTSGGKAIKQKDIAIFTRQLATMMKAGVPLLQAFDIVARGSTNPRLTRLLNEIRGDVETGTSLSSAFRKHPMQFDALYCNLVEAGEAGGILEALLDRLAIYQEKTLAIKSKIKSALMYPIAVHRRRLRRAHGDHDLRHPGVQGSVHAPSAPTCRRRRCSSSRCPSSSSPTGGRSSASSFGGMYFFLESWKRSEKMQMFMDRLLLQAAGVR